MKTKYLILVAAIAVAYGCASKTDDSKSAAQAQNDTAKLMQDSFKTRGMAKVERLQQDDTQKLCTEYAAKQLPGDVMKRIESSNLATVKYPADGVYLGDWKAGEKVAQTGRGFQWSDKPDAAAGGNCYACHQLSKKEISFGNIGPSLYRYGAQRGNSEQVVKYTWAKLYNSNAFNACSNMPRFGTQHILTEKQLRDVMALLLDPASPVNQ